MVECNRRLSAWSANRGSPSETGTETCHRIGNPLTCAKNAKKMRFTPPCVLFVAKRFSAGSCPLIVQSGPPLDVAKGHGNASHYRWVSWKHGRNQTDCRSLGARRLGRGDCGKPEHRRALRGKRRHHAIDAGVARQYAPPDCGNQMCRQRILTAPDGPRIRAPVG